MEVRRTRSCHARTRLAEDLRKAHIIIDVQKVAALLGHPIPEQDPEESDGRRR